MTFMSPTNCYHASFANSGMIISKLKEIQFFFRSLPQGKKLIFCTVLDINDNYPQFENLPYQVNISEVREVMYLLNNMNWKGFGIFG